MTVDTRTREAARVLLVSPDTLTADGLTQAVAMSDRPRRRWEVRHVPTTAMAMLEIRDGSYDVILLLSEADGSVELSETLAAMLEAVPSTPVVLLAEDAGWDARLAAMQLGASDVLHHGAAGVPDLFLTLLEAMLDRARLRRDVDAAVALARHERELRQLMEQEPATSISASLLGQGPLRERSPELARRVVADYRRIIALAVEQRSFRVEDDPSHELRSLAAVLSAAFARPSDVTWLHQQALASMMPATEGRSRLELLEEARVRVLELMGHLTSRYRTMAVPGRSA